jgi:hypothetical protein
MDVRNIISFVNIKKTNYLTWLDEIWNYFLLNYVTRFPENKSKSESRIVRLIGNRFLGSSAWFKTPTNWLLVIIDHRNTTRCYIMCHTHIYLFFVFYTVYVNSGGVTSEITMGNITVNTGVIHVCDTLLGYVYNTVRQQIAEDSP